MADAKNYTEVVDFSFYTSPKNYRHMELSVNGDEAVITLQVNPHEGLRKDTELKLNSYDLSVDIELADAINRLRFEYPNVRLVTITSGHPQVFSSGANIYMLKKSSHAFKVNFCKFTNETRLYLEEASQFSEKKFLCALNGTAAGGGYELALACDRIVLLDDKNANVSLPEVPLLGVLPGTGGLTRLTDKRKIRRDVADVFCTISEGIKGQKAKELGLVDAVYTKTQWLDGIASEGARLKQKSNSAHKGITLSEMAPKKTAQGFSYQYVDVNVSTQRVASITVCGPSEKEPTNVSAMLERGENLWLVRAFRELDDAILRLRFFYRDAGLWEFHTKGDIDLVMNAEQPLYDALKPDAHWFLREILLHCGRVLKRIDVSSRSLVAVINNESCYGGVLLEILLAVDRSYGLHSLENKNCVALSAMNNGLVPTWTNQSRLKLRFFGDDEHHALLTKECSGAPFTQSAAYGRGLITFVLDEIDFHDEIRVFKEERASLSPDALSAMEANLRFPCFETMASRIFGRLSAWQNWVFIRDNATGPRGALQSFGEETRALFDWERC